MAMSEGLVVVVTMVLLRKFWGYMYSNEEEVVRYIARMIPVQAVSFFIDGLHNSLSGMSIFRRIPRVYNKERSETMVT
jgi:MATE family multidrug resistance protein